MSATPSSYTAPSASPASSGVDSVSLRDLVIVAAARFPLLITIAAVVVVLGAIVILSKTTVYRAQTTIIVEPQTSAMITGDSAALGRAETEMMMRNQVEILSSRPVLQRVAEDLNLLEDGTPMDTMINRLERRTRVRVQEGSGVINIIARQPESQLAADTANALASAYIAVQSEYRQSLEENATVSLTARVAELAGDVREAEEALNKFQVENDLTDVTGNQSLTGLQLADLNRELLNARAELTSATAKVNQARDLRSSGASLETLSEVLSSPLISQLRQRQTDLNREAAQLRERRGPNHPEVLEMAAEQRELRSSINLQIGRFIQQLQNEVDVSETRVSNLEVQLAAIQGTFEDQSEKRIQLRELERSTQTAQEIYLTTLSRLGQTAPGSDGLAPEARILSAAVSPSAPSSTSKFLLIGLLVPLGLLAGYGISLAIEIITAGGFRSDRAISQTLGVPVLGNVPALRQLDKNRLTAAQIMSRQVIDKPQSPHSTAVRDVAALMRRPVDGRARMVAIAQTLPNEGATALSLSSARALAGEGCKTLLIDADITHPTVPGTAELSHDGPSLGEYLTGKAQAKDITLTDTESSLHLIVNIRDVMIDSVSAAEGITKLMDELSTKYDTILVKTPPILSGRNSLPIYERADELLLALRWEATPKDAVISALLQLGNAREKLAGAVMFDVDARRHDVYSHGLLAKALDPRALFGRTSS